MKLALTWLALTLPTLAMPQERGIASWYGKENKVSSVGKPLTNKAPGLAHKKLPLGTKVKVTDNKTKKSIVAVVEDRGPYIKGRIVDLNYLAAKQLGIIDRGIANVTIQPLAN